MAFSIFRMSTTTSSLVELSLLLVMLIIGSAPTTTNAFVPLSSGSVALLRPSLKISSAALQAPPATVDASVRVPTVDITKTSTTKKAIDSVQLIYNGKVTDSLTTKHQLEFLADLKQKYQHQPTFLQALEEMALSLSDLFTGIDQYRIGTSALQTLRK